MTRFDIFDIISDLRTQDAPFCVATVIRTADVTSAKAGAKAAITADGAILGHLGGGCVQRAVRQSAVIAMQNNEPRMIRVKPGERRDDVADDVSLFDSGCPSGGTVDILVEPYAPPPSVIVLGDTPIADAVRAHARLMGFRAEAPADAVAAPSAGPHDFVVIASQGQGDLAALRHAFASEATYIAMVASQRKAAVLCEKLAAEGVSDDRLKTLSAPAGLDLGGLIRMRSRYRFWRRSSCTAVGDGHRYRNRRKPWLRRAEIR